MQLPRYTKASRIVPEIQGEIQSSISPALAANVQIAKYGALAAGADSIGAVIEGIKEIKANEEYVNATSSYAAAISKAHEDLQTTAIEVDATGNLIYDEQKLLKTESDVRNTLSSTIRENIKSKSAKRGFDRWMSEKGSSASLKFADDVIEKSTKVIKQNVDLQIDNLLNEDLFDEADARNESAARTGAYGPSQYTTQKEVIQTRRVINGVWDQINASPINKNKETINEQLDQLQDPTFTGIGDVEKSTLIGKLTSILEDADKLLEDDLKDINRKWYNDNLPAAVAGELPLSALINSPIPPENMLFQDLLGRIDGKQGEPQSTGGSLQSYRDRVRRLSSRSGVFTDENWYESAQLLADEMRDLQSGLNYTDADTLVNELMGDYERMYSTKDYQALNRRAYASITGFTPGAFDNMDAMFKSQFREVNILALEFQEDLADRAAFYGPQRLEPLSAWLDQQIPIQRVKVNDSLFKDVNVNLNWEQISKTGFDDGVKKDIQQQMYRHLDLYPEDIDKAQEVISTIERLNKITLLQVMRNE